MFSFFLSRTPEEDGSITFGGYDLVQYAKAGLRDKDIFWGDINKNEKYWTLAMEATALEGANGREDALDIKAKYAIMDTGVSYALVPSADFLAVVRALGTLYGVQCQEPAGEHSMTSTYSCKCPDFE